MGYVHKTVFDSKIKNTHTYKYNIITYIKYHIISYFGFDITTFFVSALCHSHLPQPCKPTYYFIVDA